MAGIKQEDVDFTLFLASLELFISARSSQKIEIQPGNRPGVVTAAIAVRLSGWFRFLS